MQSVIWCNLCVCFFISTAIICVAYVYCLFLLLLLWYDVLLVKHIMTSLKTAILHV